MTEETPTTVDTALGPVACVDSGGGPAVLVIHGSPGGWDHAVLMGRFLRAAGFRTICPSRPGYPGTPLDERTAGVDGQAELLVALTDALGVVDFDVLGWSGGGPAGYRLAVRHPDRLRRLVVIAGLSHRYEWRMALPERLLLGTRAGNALLGLLARARPRDLVRNALAAEGDLTSADLDAAVAAVLADPEQVRFATEFLSRVSTTGDRKPGVEADMADFASLPDLELARISAPALIVQGGADSDVVPENSTFAAGRIPGSELLMVPKGTHLVCYADPAARQVQARIVGFLSGDEAPRTSPGTGTA